MLSPAPGQLTQLDESGALRPTSVPEEGWLVREGLRYGYRVIRHPQPEFAPTLFVSGAFQTMDSWARFANTFAQHTTVILVDPPGMGQSDLLPPEFGVDFLAGCLYRLLEEHRFSRVNVIAASYGTPAAFRLAHLHPDHVARVVLAGTMKEIPEHLRARVRDTIDVALSGDRALLANQVVDGLLCRDPRLPVDRRRFTERVLRSTLIQMSDMELQQYAANTARLLQHEPLDVQRVLDGPEALVFTGQHDCFTTPEHCMEVAKAFKLAWFTLVERADHLLHIQQFDVVMDLLLRFMRGVLEDPVPGCGPLVQLREEARRARIRGHESFAYPEERTALLPAS